MNISVSGTLEALALALICSGASAKCREPIACFDISGAAESCHEIQVEKERLLELRLSKTVPAQAACSYAPRDSEDQNEVHEMILNLQSRSFFYIRGLSSCSAVSNGQFSGRLIEECCDILPASGTCALHGPLLKPSK